MKTITIKEFIEDNNRTYESSSSNELYELLVENGVQRNVYYPYEKFVKEKVIFMHPSNNEVHGCISLSFTKEEVKIKELEEPTKPIKYNPNKGWNFNYE